MPIPHHQFGSTTIAKVKDSNELRQMLVDPLFESPCIVIKPNWVSTDRAEFSDVESMRILFEALDSRITVTESYSLLRSMNILNEGMGFRVGNREVNWKWLLKGEG